MNVLDFKKEIGQYIDAAYDDFVNFQGVAIDQLKEFDRICRLHNIPYFLAYGTLLGAVRDGNCIPWDYDIDVCIPIIYRERLLEALSSSIGDEYNYSYKTNISTYCAPCLRLYHKAYVETALHIDVYFIIGASQNIKCAERLKKRIYKCIKARLFKYEHLYYWGEETYQSSFRRIISKCLRLRYRLIPSQCLSLMEEKVYHKYAYESSKYVVLTCNAYDRIYPASIFCATEELLMNGMMFKVPSGYEDFLKITYGNYHQYYPIQSRFDEFYKMYKVIKDRQSHFEQCKPGVSK